MYVSIVSIFTFNTFNLIGKMYIILELCAKYFIKNIFNICIIKNSWQTYQILICYINIILFRYLKICQIISISTTVFNFVLKSIIITQVIKSVLCFCFHEFVYKAWYKYSKLLSIQCFESFFLTIKQLFVII